MKKYKFKENYKCIAEISYKNPKNSPSLVITPELSIKITDLSFFLSVR